MKPAELKQEYIRLRAGEVTQEQVELKAKLDELEAIVGGIR